MKKEELVKLGISEEIADKVIEKIGSLIPKSRFDEVIAEKNNLKEQLADRDKQLKELGKNNSDNEELKAQIKALQEENKVKATEYKNELAKIQLDSALELALTQAGARDNRAVMPFVDKSIIKLEEGKLRGLEEQISNLKTDKGYLFNSLEAGVVTPKGATPAPTPSPEKVENVTLDSAFDNLFK